MRPAVVPAAGEGGVGAMPEDRLTEYLDGIDTAAEIVSEACAFEVKIGRAHV